MFKKALYNFTHWRCKWCGAVTDLPWSSAPHPSNNWGSPTIYSYLWGIGKVGEIIHLCPTCYAKYQRKEYSVECTHCHRQTPFKTVTEGVNGYFCPNCSKHVEYIYNDVHNPDGGSLY